MQAKRRLRACGDDTTAPTVLAPPRPSQRIFPHEPRLRPIFRASSPAGARPTWKVAPWATSEVMRGLFTSTNLRRYEPRREVAGADKGPLQECLTAGAARLRQQVRLQTQRRPRGRPAHRPRRPAFSGERRGRITSLLAARTLK